jgi:hypothetical protein
MKHRAKISSNNEVRTGVPERLLSVTLAVATIPSRAGSRCMRTSGQSRLGCAPVRGCLQGNWRNTKLRMGHQETRKNGDTTRPEVSMPTTPTPSPLSEMDQWVSAKRLLEILWDEQSRPSLQWIRKETKRRMLPHIRRGRLIFYRPRSVMEWFNQRECRPNSMK